MISLSFGILTNRKAGTYVVTAWTAFYGLFYIDYGPREHVFSDLQRWYRRKLDGLLGIDVKAAKQISDGREKNSEKTDSINNNADGIPKKEEDSIAVSQSTSKRWWAR